MADGRTTSYKATDESTEPTSRYRYSAASRSSQVRPPWPAEVKVFSRFSCNALDLHPSLQLALLRKTDIT